MFQSPLLFNFNYILSARPSWEIQYSIKDKDPANAASERPAAVTRDSVSQTAY